MRTHHIAVASLAALSAASIAQAQGCSVLTQYESWKNLPFVSSCSVWAGSSWQGDSCEGLPCSGNCATTTATLAGQVRHRFCPIWNPGWSDWCFGQGYDITTWSVHALGGGRIMAGRACGPIVGSFVWSVSATMTFTAPVAALDSDWLESGGTQPQGSSTRYFRTGESVQLQIASDADCEHEWVYRPCADQNSNGTCDEFETIAAAFGDFDASGTVDGADLGSLLAAWGPVTPATIRYDLNHDNAIDGFDLGLLLARWGQGA